MRIGYCLPYGVQNKEGIDLLKERMLALSAKEDIVLFSPFMLGSGLPLNGVECRLLDELDDVPLRESLDLLVFQLGEKPHLYAEITKMQRKYSGVVEFEEISLQDGILSESVGEECILDVCLMGQVIENAKGVIVRSEFAKQLILGQRPEVPVETIQSRSGKDDAAKYIEFFRQVVDHTWLPNHEDRLVEWLCELGLTDEKYVQHMAQTVEPLFEITFTS